MTSRAFAQRSLLAMALAWALLCGAAACGENRPSMLSGPIPGAQVHAAYQEVQRLLADSMTLAWPTAPRMSYLRIFEVRQPEPGQRLVGAYINTTRVSKRGRMSQVERIEVYLMPHEECFVQDVLVHEILHAVHRRLKFLQYPQAHAIGPEEFVYYFQGQTDQRPCHERN